MLTPEVLEHAEYAFMLGGPDPDDRPGPHPILSRVFRALKDSQNEQRKSSTSAPSAEKGPTAKGKGSKDKTKGPKDKTKSTKGKGRKAVADNADDDEADDDDGPDERCEEPNTKNIFNESNDTRFDTIQGEFLAEESITDPRCDLMRMVPSPLQSGKACHYSYTSDSSRLMVEFVR